jgi:hypothetical protein
LPESGPCSAKHLISLTIDAVENVGKSRGENPRDERSKLSSLLKAPTFIDRSNRGPVANMQKAHSQIY